MQTQQPQTQRPSPVKVYTHCRMHRGTGGCLRTNPRTTQKSNRAMYRG